MPRVVHFEIHAEDLPRAVQFYRTVFGWDIQEWGGQNYWLITTGPDSEPGINGALLQRRGTIDGEAVIAYVCTIDVANLDDTLTKALTSGGVMALEKMEVPGIGWLAYCKDTEGNIFGIMQRI